MGIKDRKKASDIFRETRSPFARKVEFEEAFPQIDTIIVEVEEEGEGVFAEINKQIYRKNDLGEFIDCSNSICYNGGFSIGQIIRQMVSEERTDLETSKICQGFEGSPKGRNRYRSCLNRFKIGVHINYIKQ